MTGITENFSGYDTDELFSPALRENNSRRRGLIVNRIQGKHVPASPSRVLELFDRLGKRIPPFSGKTAVIGFAETATAIGAALSSAVNSEIYIHTTREELPSKLIMADFSEEHSHAPKQMLFSNDKNIFRDADRIIFAEDELTTGKTILNLINAVRDYVPSKCSFAAASLINGMTRERLSVFRENNTDLYYTVKLEDTQTLQNGDNAPVPEKDLAEGYDDDFSYIEAPGITDPRRGSPTDKYISDCTAAARYICEKTSRQLAGCRKIDVIGTEEFMYPALILGRMYESLGFEVYSHSTTRSPIVPSKAEGYPLFSRAKLPSFYDKNRTTYLYNIFPADAAVVFTDTADFSEETAAALSYVLNADKKIFVRSRAL